MNLIKSDKKYIWHPFTQMKKWCEDKNEPLIIQRAKGNYLYDTNSRKYIDGNSSIWTNIHGHSHPYILKYLAKQMKQLQHSSFLGLSNKPAIKLAKKLIKKTDKISLGSILKNPKLERVFYASDGSCAIECAIKMAVQYFQFKNESSRNHFISFKNSYHGDTLGASSLGDRKSVV